jgi:hypothetical protein
MRSGFIDHIQATHDRKMASAIQIFGGGLETAPERARGYAAELETKGVMDTIYPWWWDEREFPRRGVMTEWFYNPLKGQPRYIDVYRMRALAASEWVTMCTKTIIEEISQVPWEIKPKDPELEASPPEDLAIEIDRVKYFLSRPNDNKGSTLNTLIRAALRDSLEIDAMVLVKGYTPNSYMRHPAGGFELKPQGQRELVELTAYDGGSFLKEADVNGIEYRFWQYSYLHPAVAPIEFDVDEVIYGMRYPRSYSVYGWGEIQSMETILNLLINSAYTNATMFQDYSVPSGIVSFTGSEEDEQRLREYFRTEVKGRFHKVAVLNKEASFAPLAMSARDLEFLNGQRWFARLCWAIYGLTPTELGFQDEIRETGKAMASQGKIQKRKAIYPVLRLFEDIMNLQIINEFSDDLKFEFQYVDKEEEMADDQLAVELQKAGFVKPNEWRKKRKMGGPVWWGEQPMDITLAELKAQSPKPFGGGGGASSSQPETTLPPSPSPGREALRSQTQEEKTIEPSADNLSLYETLKQWGGRPGVSYDFADKEDRATPIFTWDSSGNIKQVREPKSLRKIRSIQDELKRLGRKRAPYWDRNDSVYNGMRMIHQRETIQSPGSKQYARPQAPKRGPYAGGGRGEPHPMGALGNRPDEPIRRGDLLPGENPEEVQRSREALETRRPRRGLGTERVSSPEEMGDVTRRDPRLAARKSGMMSHRWERDEIHGRGNVPTAQGANLGEAIRTNKGAAEMPERVGDKNPEQGDNQTPRVRDRLAPARKPTDPAVDPRQSRELGQRIEPTPAPEQHPKGRDDVPHHPLATTQPGVDGSKRRYPQGPSVIGATGVDRREQGDMGYLESRPRGRGINKSLAGPQKVFFTGDGPCPLCGIQVRGDDPRTHHSHSLMMPSMWKAATTAYSEEFVEALQAQKDINGKIAALMKSYRAGQMMKEECLSQGLEAINKHHDVMLEIIRKKIGPMIEKQGIVTLPPEVTEKMEARRSEAIEAFKKIIDDAKA